MRSSGRSKGERPPSDSVAARADRWSTCSSCSFEAAMASRPGAVTFDHGLPGQLPQLLRRRRERVGPEIDALAEPVRVPDGPLAVYSSRSSWVNARSMAVMGWAGSRHRPSGSRRRPSRGAGRFCALAAGDRLSAGSSSGPMAGRGRTTFRGPSVSSHETWTPTRLRSHERLSPRLRFRVADRHPR